MMIIWWSFFLLMGIDIVTVKGTPVCLSTHSISNLVWSRDPGKNNSLGLTDVNVCQILYLYLMKIYNGCIYREWQWYYVIIMRLCPPVVLLRRISFMSFHFSYILYFMMKLSIYQTNYTCPAVVAIVIVISVSATIELRTNRFCGKTLGGVINIYFFWHLSSKETEAVMTVCVSLLVLLFLAVAVVPQYSHIFPLYSVSVVRKV